MDQREYVVDWEETIRTAFAGLMATRWHAMPGQLTDSILYVHNATVIFTVKRMVTDPVTGARTFESHPIHPDVIVHFPGGAGAVLTHGLAAQDEGLLVYADRDVDSWRQSGGQQQPVTNRMSGYQDPHLIPGIRSDPRKLQQVAPDAMHARSDDKTVVHEMKPGTGIRSFHADPSTPAASPSFDPLSMASAFYHHVVQSAVGLLGQAVSSGGTHEAGVTHQGGAFMRALNGLHQVLAMPSGALLSAFSGAHTVTANSAGVQIASSVGIGLQCPPGTLSLPTGGISGSAVQAGGDLSGNVGQAEVVSLAHVDARSLPVATSDAAAASAGVLIGGLYRDTSIASGKNVLVMRAA